MPRILHIDDENAEHLLLKANLKRHLPGLELEWEGTPRNLLEGNGDWDFDCILCDFQMPEIDGLQVLKALRERGNDSPFIFLTGQGNEKVAAEALRSGADDYFTKDVGFAHYERLANSIERLIESREREHKRVEAEARIRHLNLVLRAIRDVNQLITKEHDTGKLLDEACDILTQTRGYPFAVIALINEAGEVAKLSSAGQMSESLGLREGDLFAKNATACLETTRNTSGVMVIEELDTFCGNCTLLDSEQGYGALGARLEFSGRFFGVLLAALPQALVGDAEEQSLFEEVSGDISFALHRSDLESRKEQAEQALKESEGHFRALFEPAGVGMFIHDFEGRFVDANPRGCENLGYTREELLGMTVEDVDAEFVSKDHRKNFWSQLSPGKPVILEGVHKRKDGSTYPVEVRLVQTEIQGERYITATAYDISERMQNLEALRESEQRYRTLLQNAAMPALMHTEGKVVFINKAALLEFGFESAEEAIGVNPLDFIHPDHREEVKERISRVYSQKRKLERIELEMLRNDGSAFSVEAFAGPAEYKGKAASLVIFQNITRRKEHEQALQESEERFRIVAHATSDLIFEWDIASGSLEWYGDIDGILGYEKGTIPRTVEGWFRLLHPDDRIRMQAAIEPLVNPSEPVAYEYKVVAADGSTRIWSSFSRQIVDESGRPVKWIGACSDITDRRRALEALRQSEEKFRAMVESTSDWIWESDIKGRFTYISPKVKDILGYEPEEVLGKGIIDFMLPDEAERTLAILEDAVSRLEPVRDIVHTAISKNGRTVVIEANGVPIFDAAGECVGYRGIARDISELRHSYKRLEEANKELAAFAYTVSHDLRAPLRHMRSYSELLRDGYTDGLDEDGKHLLERIVASGERMDMMINDILQLSTASRSELEVEEVDLTMLFRSIALEGPGDSPERKVEMKVEEGLSAHCDRGLMRQMLQNLFDNAVKFTGKREQAVIEFGSETRRGERVFFVRDNGIGFESEDAKGIFEPFRRLDDSGEYEGSGIGLATVKRIVQRHGGRIWAEAEPDKGATFYFTLG